MVNANVVNAAGHWLKGLLATYAAVQISGLIASTFFFLMIGAIDFTHSPELIIYGFLVTVIPTVIYAVLLSSIALKVARRPHAYKFIILIAAAFSLAFFFAVVVWHTGGPLDVKSMDRMAYMLLYSSLFAGTLGGVAAVATIRYSLSQVETS